MSVDILSNLSKEVVSKKVQSVETKEENSSKKEGGSLFDSLMKDIQKDTKSKTDQNSNNSQKNSEKSENKETSTNNKVAQRANKEISAETSKKVSDGLVDLVIDKVKNKSNEDISTVKSEKNSEVLKSTLDNSSKEDTKKTDTNKTSEDLKNNISKTDTSKTNEDLKTTVDKNTTIIKEATQEIKNSISKLDTEEKSQIKDETKKTDTSKIDSSKTNEDVKTTVDKNTTIIKEATQEIKNSISKLDTEEKSQIKDETKKIDISKTNEDLKTTVDKNTTIIKEATQEIKNSISKLDTEEKSQIKDAAKKTDTSKTEDVKITVDKNTTIIKEATQEIKNSISKLDTEDKSQIKDETKKTDASKTEDLKTIVDKNAETLKNIDTTNSDSTIEEKTISAEVGIDKNIKESSKNNLNQTNIQVNTQILKDEAVVDGKNTLLANGFLNSQQKNKETVSLAQLTNAKEIIEKNQTIKSVKDSGNMLDLNVEKTEVEHSDKSGKVQKLDILTAQEKESQLQMMQNRGLSRFMMEKDSYIRDEQLTQTAELNKATIEENSSQKDKNVMLNVPPAVVETIQSKIIGAHQKVGSFMSEVARNMYLNYKPPFTSFKVNLNPANLGSIAVVMRASKTDNSVSVSMNMSNNATMETFTENKAALQTALQRQLGESSNVTLNFDMQDGSGNEQFNQSGQNNNSEQQNKENSSQQSQSQNNTIEEENSEALEYL